MSPEAHRERTSFVDQPHDTSGHGTLITLLRGLLAIGLGLSLFFVPDRTGAMLGNFMGLFWLTTGLVSLRGDPVIPQRRLARAIALVVIFTGLLMLSRKFVDRWMEWGSIVNAVGAVIILTGVLHMVGGVQIGEGRGYARTRLSVLLGVFEVVLGALLILSPTGRGEVIHLVAAVWALIGGALLIGDALLRRRRGRRAASGECSHASNSRQANGSTTIRRATLMAFLREIYLIWITERPAQFAASLAYYGIFAFVPIIFIGLTIAGVLIDEVSAADQLLGQVSNTLGADAAGMLEDSLARLSQERSRGTVLASVISFLALLSAASLMFFQLQFTLNSIWRMPTPEGGQTSSYVRKRLMAFAMVFGVGLFLLAATLVNLAVGALGSLLGLDATAVGITFLTNVGLATVALALIYKVLPDAEVTWRDVWIGSGLTAVIIALGLSLVRIYLSRSSAGSALEAAGAVAVFLLTFYFVGQIFVFGAVFTRVYASIYGSKIIPRASALAPDATVDRD